MFICSSFFLNFSAVAQETLSDFKVACSYYHSNPEFGEYGQYSNYYLSHVVLGYSHYVTGVDNHNQEVLFKGKLVNGFLITDISNKDKILFSCKRALVDLSNHYINTLFKNINFKVYDIRGISSSKGLFSTEHVSNFIYPPIRYLTSKEIDELKLETKIPEKTETQTDDKILPKKIKQIVIFGDSLSDQGNLKNKTIYIPEYPYWFGRFSDGFIWPDYLSKDTNIPILNLSFGGATTTDYHHKSGKDIKLWGQALIAGNLENYVEYYNKKISDLNTINTLTKSEINNNAHEVLNIIWIGANDFLSVLNSTELANKFFDEPDSEYGKNVIIHTAISGIERIYNSLLKKGYKNFAIVNLPNIGYTPYVLTTTYREGMLNDAERYKEFSTRLTNAINEYNQILKNKIEEINKKSEHKVVLIDVNKQLDNMIKGRHMFDENKSFDYQFDYLNSDVLIPNQKENIYIQKPCFSGDPAQTINAMLYLLPDQNGYLKDFERKHICSENKLAEKFKTKKHAIFWDNPHPSSYTHCFLSYFIHKTLGDENFIAKNNTSLEDVKMKCRYIVNNEFNIN